MGLARTCPVFASRGVLTEEVGGGRSQFDKVSVTVLLREEVTFFDFLVVA